MDPKADALHPTEPRGADGPAQGSTTPALDKWDLLLVTLFQGWRLPQHGS